MQVFRQSKRQKLLATSFCLIVLFFVTGRSTLAQSQDTQPQSPEVQQLKERLQQLEQTVKALQEHINTIETRKDAAPAIIQADYSSTAAPAPAPEPAAKPQNPKGESTFQVYGFAMLDAGYQFKQNDPNWFDVIRPVKLPSFPNEFAPNGKTYYGVRQSRFGVKSTTRTDYGELKTQFEFELFGTGVDAGQTTFRLRHAYGELGKFGAGQYWSPFMDIDVFPNSLEYWGPNGMVFFRNVQVRWTPIQGASNVVIALERPGASADGGRYADRIDL